MNRIPPEIDQLMWEVAERQDQEAVEEFGRRFPDQRHELTKRLNMLQGLRGARPTGTVRSVPSFRATARPAFPRWAPTGAVLGLVAVGLGSYWAAVQIMTPPAAAPALLEASPSNLQAGSPQDRQRTYQQEAIVEESGSPSPSKPVDSEKPGPGRGADPEPSTPSVFHRPINLAIDDAPLLDVLQMVSDASKLKLTIGPMMPNPKVSVAYHQQSAMSVLDDLGRQYGFAVFEQEEGHVLIVPHSKRQDTGETGR